MKQSGRDAERKRMSRDVPRCPPESPGVPLSDADTNTGKRQNKPTRSARGSRLHDDFRPDIEYARQQVPDIDAEGEAQKFADYWRSRAGAAGVKCDWPATWRNWIRSCRESGRYAKRRSSGGIHDGVVMR